MRKYWAIFKLTFQDQVEYPAEVFYWLFLTLIPLFVMAFLWLTVYQTSSEVGGFNLSSMITYFFLVMVINRLNAHSAFWIAQMIREGRLSKLLLQPFDFLAYVLARTMSRKLISFVISLPIILLVFFSLRSYIIFPQTPFYAFSFLISLLLSISLFAFLGLILGLVSFWTIEIGSLFYFYYTLLDFLGGAFLPLSFFPKLLTAILNFLPFRYLFYFPVAVYLGKVTAGGTMVGILVAFIWLGLLYFLYKFLWQVGLRRYGSVGG